MKIYTRTGDSGRTGLFGGPRVEKDDVRIEAYGTVDELNAALGAARAAGVTAAVDEQLAQIQHELFSIGAELAAPTPDKHGLRVIDAEHVARLESWIDAHEQGLTPLKAFILPAGTAAAAAVHVARAVCRRCERRVVTLGRAVEGSVSEAVLIYLNRLSDLLFVLTRVVNAQAGIGDMPWQQPPKQGR